MRGRIYRFSEVIRVGKLFFGNVRTPLACERHIDDGVNDDIGNVDAFRPKVPRQPFAQNALRGFRW